MKNIFVDTNVFLSFYAYTSDDLAQLEKLVGELKAGNVRLLITDQVYDEFRRNRESKIAEALKNFGEKAGIDSFPRMIQHYDEFGDLSAAVETYKKLKSSISKKLQIDIEKKTLPADNVVQEILNVAGVIKSEGTVIDEARLRMSVGKPPGKSGSLGDAINWELLLRTCKAPCDLYVVTNDKDYLSPVSPLRFNEYLSDEWAERCGGKVLLFSTLRDVLKDVTPEIQLSVAANAVTTSATSSVVAPGNEESGYNEGEYEEGEYIERCVRALARSASFRQTHLAISRMPKISLLSPEQVARLFRASVENNDISWINADDDVQAFFSDLYETYPNILEEDIQEKFKELFG